MRAERRALVQTGHADSTARLLIPVEMGESCQWAVRYAMERARTESLEVCLLFLTAPALHPQPIFRTDEEVASQVDGDWSEALACAAIPLREAGIACAEIVREGDRVQGVLDAAEELACTEILVPEAGWWDPIGSAAGRRLQRASQNVQVTLVAR